MIGLLRLVRYVITPLSHPDQVILNTDTTFDQATMTKTPSAMRHSAYAAQTSKSRWRFKVSVLFGSIAASSGVPYRVADVRGDAVDIISASERSRLTSRTGKSGIWRVKRRGSMSRVEDAITVGSCYLQREHQTSGKELLLLTYKFGHRNDDP